MQMIDISEEDFLSDFQNRCGGGPSENIFFPQSKLPIFESNPDQIQTTILTV